MTFYTNLCQNLARPCMDGCRTWNIETCQLEAFLFESSVQMKFKKKYLSKTCQIFLRWFSSP